MEQGFDLNDEPKKVLAAVKRATVSQKFLDNGEGMKIEEEPATFSDIKEETDLHDPQISRGLKELQKKGLIQKNEGKYKIDPDYRWKVLKLARKSSDKLYVDSYPYTHIISSVASQPSVSTTIYGLKSDTFNKRDGLNIDITKEETFKFSRGIEAKELFGKSFGLPKISYSEGEAPAKNMDLKGTKELEQMDEDELIDRQIEHYRELKENTSWDWDDVIRHIIERHREEKIKYKELGQNIIVKLESMREQAAYEASKKDYDRLIDEKNLDSEVEKILKEFKVEFLGLLEQVSGALPGAIFILNGRGCGIGNRWPKDMSQEEADERVRELAKSVKNLYPPDKSKSDFQPYTLSEGIEKEELGEKQLELIEFLEKVREENIGLYGIKTSFLARSGKGIYTEIPVDKEKLNQI